jgi:hypothetical protein
MSVKRRELRGDLGFFSVPSDKDLNDNRPSRRMTADRRDPQVNFVLRIREALNLPSDSCTTPKKHIQCQHEAWKPQPTVPADASP